MMKNKNSNQQNGMNWQSTAATNDERKWSVYVTQKILAANNNNKPSSASISPRRTPEENNNQDENFFKGLSPNQVKSAAPSLHSLFSNPVKFAMHYERLLQDASSTIIDRRKQQASPLRKVMKYFSPSPNNNDENNRIVEDSLTNKFKKKMGRGERDNH